MHIKKTSHDQLITWITGIVIAGLVIIIPLGYFVISYNYLNGRLVTEAENNATIITQIISANPEYWEFEQIRLKEYLSHRPRSGEKEIRRLINNKNKVVAESVDDLKSPVLTRSFVVMDAGFVVGKIEISRSLMSLLKRSGLLLLLILPVGCGLFLAFYLVPIRTMRNEEKLRRQSEDEKDKAIAELTEAVSKIKTLSGMLPICASCKKIRDDKGYWEEVASYITKHSAVLFSHGLCPECEKKSYEELEAFLKDNKSESGKKRSE
ncbi:MAG: hypothetical protein WA946_13910 [Nitrospirota bacterium]